MGLVIPEDVLHAAHMSENELRLEIAVLLFARSKLTMSQASRLADMDPLQFQGVLASRQIPVHYDVAEFEQDIATLRKLDRS